MDERKALGEASHEPASAPPAASAGETAGCAPPVRSWPFVAIIVCDMLLLLLLGFLAWFDLGARLDGVRSQNAALRAEVDDLKLRVQQLEAAWEIEHAPKGGQPAVGGRRRP